MEFDVKVWGDEIIVIHQKQGHTYRFDVSSAGVVELAHARIEANPKARRDAKGYLYEARHVARTALAKRRLR